MRINSVMRKVARFIDDAAFRVICATLWYALAVAAAAAEIVRRMKR